MRFGIGVVALLSILSLSGCGSDSDSIVIHSAAERPRRCYVEVYEVDTDLTRPYEKLCVVSVLEDTLKEAKEKAMDQACKCGADALILRTSGSSESLRTSMLIQRKKAVLNVLAVRYTDERLGPRQFKGSMTREVAFPLTDRAKWSRGWVSSPEYLDLGNYVCDGISIQNLDRGARMWTTGLELKAKPRGGGRFEVQVKTSIHNLGDKVRRVSLTFDLVNGEEVASTATITGVVVKPGGEEDKSTSLLVWDKDIRTDPPTLLRLTLNTSAP